MGGLLWTNGFLLTALASLAIPILIHLLIRQRIKTVKFSTLRFFLPQDEKKRRRISHWLLLFLRLALLTLIVLAFARPFRPLARETQSAPQRLPRQVVFVVDLSASMRIREGSLTRWEKARRQLLESLGQLGPDDKAALITASEKVEVLSPLDTPAKVMTLAEKLEPTWETANLADAIREAATLLPPTAEETSPLIHVLTDLQSASARHLAQLTLSSRISLNITGVISQPAENMSLTQVTLKGAQRKTAWVNLSNPDTKPHSQVRVSLHVDGTPSSTRTLDVAASTNLLVELSLPQLKPGWHECLVQLNPADAWPDDNVYYRSLYVPAPRRIATLENHELDHLWQEHCYFLSRALGSTPPAEADGARYLIQKDYLYAFAGKLLKSQAQAAIIPSLPTIPGDLPGVLNEYVKKGGGLVFFAGQGFDAAAYARAFGDLLPVAPSHVDTYPAQDDDAWRLGDFDKESPLFSLFAGTGNGDLTLPEFRQRVVCEPLPGSEVLARYQDGVPFAVEKRVGHARVLFINTSADTSWSDWPKRKTFLPWIHALMDYATQRQSGESVLADWHKTVSRQATLPLGAGTDADSSLILIGPGDRRETLTLPEDGKLTGVSLPQPGLYRLMDEATGEKARLAVNLPAEESDPTFLTVENAQNTIVRIQEPPREGVMSHLLGPPQRTEYWRLLLLAALVLLICEPLLANRT